MDVQLWLAFVAASAALLLIPGPTVMLVLSYAVSQGRRVALTTALGVALGDFIAMSASLAGLGALVLGIRETVCRDQMGRSRLSGMAGLDAI